MRMIELTLEEPTGVTRVLEGDQPMAIIYTPSDNENVLWNTLPPIPFRFGSSESKTYAIHDVERALHKTFPENNYYHWTSGGETSSLSLNGEAVGGVYRRGGFWCVGMRSGSPFSTELVHANFREIEIAKNHLIETIGVRMLERESAPISIPIKDNLSREEIALRIYIEYLASAPSHSIVLVERAFRDADLFIKVRDGEKTS